MYTVKQCASPQERDCNCGGCGASYEYNCRVLNTPEGNVIYFNDCKATTQTLKAAQNKP